MNAPVADTVNPKDKFGSLKVSLSKLPAIAVAHGAHAMMDGAIKYGPYNWREKKVIAGIYVDAAKRHLDAWFEGQERATDSEVHHLGHVIACAAILLDAQATGNLVDDRPLPGDVDKVFNSISEIIKRRKEQARVDQSWADAAADIGLVPEKTTARREAELVGRRIVDGDLPHVEHPRGSFPSHDQVSQERGIRGLPKMQEQQVGRIHVFHQRADETIQQAADRALGDLNKTVIPR